MQVSARRSGRPTRRKRRTRTHVLTGAGTLLFTFALFQTLSSPDLVFKLSLSSGHAALMLIAVSLLIGPWRAWHSRRGVPVHLDLRRDVGLWARLMSIAHVGVGLFVHLRGRPWLYFVYPADQPHAFPCVTTCSALPITPDWSPRWWCSCC